MTLEYQQVANLAHVNCILDEYIAWYTKLTRSLIYPGQEASTSVLEIPGGLLKWAQTADSSRLISGYSVKDLLALHNDLCVQAQALLAQASVTSTAPNYDTYKCFCTLFEEFAAKLGRLEKDALSDNNGFDLLTGLRSQDVLHSDIKREMDRLERDGKPFSVALLRIDNFEHLQNSLQPDHVGQILKTVADMVKRSLRSFDDAYVLDGGMFVLSLKQTESDGGIRALERLRKELEAHAGERITLSSCIAEPVPENDITHLINNLKSDLDNFESKSGAVLEYFEQTPLQRFMKDQTTTTN